MSNDSSSRLLTSINLRVDSMSDERPGIVPEKPEQFTWLDKYSTKPDAEEIWSSIVAHDLVRNVAELEVKGLTVVLPDAFMGASKAVEIREAVLDVIERRHGKRPDLSASPEAGIAVPWAMVPYLLLEDAVFQEAVVHPVTLTLVTHLLGRSACLSSVMALVKEPFGRELELHNDSHLIPPPLPVYSQVCNATIPLTDYTAESGALCYVPGSHRLHRNPVFPEGNDSRVLVEAPAGSLIVWNSNVWHGSFVRKEPGLRLSMLMFFARPHLRPEERYRSDVTPEMLESMDPAFRKLLGFNIGWGWGEEGPPPPGGDLNLVSRSALD